MYSWGEHPLSSSAGFGTMGEGQITQPVAATPEPSVVPINDNDVVKIWPRLIAMLKPHGSALAAGLSLATLHSLKDGLAVIRFSAEGETFAKAWASNGKREIIGRTLSQIRGAPVELKFEIAAPGEPAPAAVAMIAAPPPRVSVEIPDEIRGDPLVQAVLKEFGGEIVKCE
jgi:hypothetical protein